MRKLFALASILALAISLPTLVSAHPQATSANGVQADQASPVDHFRVRIRKISPTAGPVNMQVTLHAEPLDQNRTTNLVTFISEDGRYEALIVGSVHGDILTFDVPDAVMPPCFYLKPPCLPPTVPPTPPGIYQVSITNSHGTSNTVSFTVTP